MQISADKIAWVLKGLSEVAHLNPFIGEPLVLLSQIYLNHGEPQRAKIASASALQRLYDTGFAWDGRRSWKAWVAMARMIHFRSSRLARGVPDLPRSADGHLHLPIVWKSTDVYGTGSVIFRVHREWCRHVRYSHIDATHLQSQIVIGIVTNRKMHQHVENVYNPFVVDQFQLLPEDQKKKMSLLYFSNEALHNLPTIVDVDQESSYFTAGARYLHGIRFMSSCWPHENLKWFVLLDDDAVASPQRLVAFFDMVQSRYGDPQNRSYLFGRRDSLKKNFDCSSIVFSESFCNLLIICRGSEFSFV